MQHKPVWKAFIEEPATVQFTHRILAMLTFAAGIWVWMRARGFHVPGRLRCLFNMLPVLLLAQAGLGVVTLLHAVPVTLGTLHQGGALCVLTLLVWLLWEIPAIRSMK